MIGYYTVSWVGRYPLYIEAAAKCIQYWFHVLKQSTLYSKNAYQSLLTLHEKGHENWIAHVKSLLRKCDFGLVWLFEGVGEVNLFLRDFKDAQDKVSPRTGIPAFYKVLVLKCITALKVLMELRVS